MTENRGMHCTEDGARVPLSDDGFHPIYGPCPTCGIYFIYDGDDGCYQVIDRATRDRIVLGKEE